MSMKRLLVSASVLLLGLAVFVPVNQAQGPLYDKVEVNLPYTVTVGDRVLQPGDYVIRQMPSSGGASRVLLIYTDDGMKFETSAMTIPALDNNTPEDTKVVLHHFGPDYYFDKIWIQGKNYGYEFPLPDAVKARQKERMEPLSVAARYEAVPAETETTTAQTQTQTQSETQTEKQTETQTEVTQAQPAPEAAQPAPEAAQPETQPAQPAPEAQPAPAPAPQTAENVPPAAAPEASRAMPETSANWLAMLLAGGMLSGAGLTLRRR